MDLPEAEENLAAFRRRFPDREVVPVSAKENEGIEDLKACVGRRLRRNRSLDKIDSTVSSYVKTAGRGRNEYS